MPQRASDNDPPTAAAGAVARYLAESGWSRTELARRAGLNQSALSRILNGVVRGKRGVPIGELAALKLERATVAAKQAGETDAAPLFAIDLLGTDPTLKKSA